MRMKKIIIPILFVVFFFICIFLMRKTIKDVSYDEKYVHLIGRELTSVKELLIYGFTEDFVSPMDRGIKEVDHYFLNEPPKMLSRSIVSRAHLPAGTLIQIKKTFHRMYFFDANPEIKFQIEILSDKSYNDQPIYIGDTLHKNIVVLKNGKAEINSELFELVDIEREKNNET